MDQRTSRRGGGGGGGYRGRGGGRRNEDVYRQRHPRYEPYPPPRSVMPSSEMEWPQSYINSAIGELTKSVTEDVFKRFQPQAPMADIVENIESLTSNLDLARVLGLQRTTTTPALEPSKDNSEDRLHWCSLSQPTVVEIDTWVESCRRHSQKTLVLCMDQKESITKRALASSVEYDPSSPDYEERLCEEVWRGSTFKNILTLTEYMGAKMDSPAWLAARDRWCDPWEGLLAEEKQTTVVPPFVSRAAHKLMCLHAQTRKHMKCWEVMERAGRSVLSPPFRFADLACGPGAFSEYILNFTESRATGFCFTARGPLDMKTGDFQLIPRLAANSCLRHYYGEPDGIPLRSNKGERPNGDLTHPAHVRGFIDFVASETHGQGLHLVVADGGFDFSGVEADQDAAMSRLLLCECILALATLCKGGSFIVKVFDLYCDFNIELVYYMSQFFTRWCILKPSSSRPMNAERYLVLDGLKEWTRVETRLLAIETLLDINSRAWKAGSSCVDRRAVITHERQKRSAQDLTCLTEACLLDKKDIPKEFLASLAEANTRHGERRLRYLKRARWFVDQATTPQEYSGHPEYHLPEQVIEETRLILSRATEQLSMVIAGRDQVPKDEFWTDAVFLNLTVAIEKSLSPSAHYQAITKSKEKSLSQTLHHLPAYEGASAFQRSIHSAVSSQSFRHESARSVVALDSSESRVWPVEGDPQAFVVPHGGVHVTLWTLRDSSTIVVWPPYLKMSPTRVDDRVTKWAFPADSVLDAVLFPSMRCVLIDVWLLPHHKNLFRDMLRAERWSVLATVADCMQSKLVSWDPPLTRKQLQNLAALPEDERRDWYVHCDDQSKMNTSLPQKQWIRWMDSAPRHTNSAVNDSKEPR